MSWTPSRTMHLGLNLVETIAKDAEACGDRISRELRWRMTELIMNSLGNAYSMGKDDAEMDLLTKYQDKSTDGLPHIHDHGNGQATVSMTHSEFGHSVPKTIGEWIEAGEKLPSWYELHARNAKIEINPPFAISEGQGPISAEHIQEKIDSLVLTHGVPISEAKPAKRGRGRPKGSKKKKKVATAKTVFEPVASIKNTAGVKEE